MLTNRKKLLLAGAGSAFLHLVLLLGVAIIAAHQPSEPPPPPPPEPIHLEIVKSPPVLPEQATPTPERRVVDTSGMKSAERPPSNAKIEGDKNTTAASEEPPSGDQPLPTQKGRVAPAYAFDTAPPALPMPPADNAPTALPPPAATRVQVRDNSENPAPTLVRNDLTMIDAEPAAPQPEEDNPYDPAFRSTAPPPPLPVKRPTETSAYRPMAERTASNGNITTRGASSVEAVTTPYGRYRKAVLDSIRAVWTQQIQARRDLASLGTIRFHFAIDRSGHVHSPAMLSNSSNDVLASITLDAITTATIPPIPPEVADSLNSAMLQLDVTFECL